MAVEFYSLRSDMIRRARFHLLLSDGLVPQKEGRIEAHIFVAFMAYALHVTLRRRLRDLAPGLTPRSVLEKFGSIQMIDIHLPTTDGRKVIMSRYTQPERELQMLLQQLRLSLPDQPPPRITARGEVTQ